MGTSASSGGSIKSSSTSRAASRTPSSKEGTPGPRPYSAQHELAKTGMSTANSKFSSSSRQSNYKSNYSESVHNYRQVLRNQQNVLNIRPKQALEYFIEIQYKLDHIESRGVFEAIKSVETELQIIQASKYEAESIYKRLYDQNEKDRVNDFFAPTVQGFYVNKINEDEPITPDQAEYLQNLNLLEMAENEFRQVNQKYNNSKKIYSFYKKEYKKGIKLQAEQMNILYSVFQGDYGSELEEQLENEIHELAENKDQLKSALIKLVHSRSLIIFSYNKLQNAEDKWIELISSNISHKDKVYLATEVRNSLAGAYHFLNNSRSYLKNEDMPYCADQDLKNLLYQAAAVYQDMTSLEAQRNALKNIQVMRKRCLALSHWFETVIKMFIPLMTQHSLVSNQYNQKREQLKYERIRLLNQIIKRESENEDSLNEDSDKNEESDTIKAPSPVLKMDKFDKLKSDSRPIVENNKPISPVKKQGLESLSSLETNSNKDIKAEEQLRSSKQASSKNATVKENESSKHNSSKFVHDGRLTAASNLDSDKFPAGDSNKNVSKSTDLKNKSDNSKDQLTSKTSLREARHLNLKHTIKNISIEKREGSISTDNSPVLETISLANNDQMNLIDQKSSRTDNRFLMDTQKRRTDKNSNIDDFKLKQQKSISEDSVNSQLASDSNATQANSINEKSLRKSNKNTKEFLKPQLPNIEQLRNKYENNPFVQSLMNPDNDQDIKDDDDFLRPVRPVSGFNPDIPIETVLQPSKDLLLIDIEQIKQCYKQQEEQWNSLLNKSRQNADDRLNNILLSHEKSRLYKF